MEITIEKRVSDYKAFKTGDPRIWGCGRTPSEAVGDLITAHPEEFNVRITEEY